MMGQAMQQSQTTAYCLLCTTKSAISFWAISSNTLDADSYKAQTEPQSKEASERRGLLSHADILCCAELEA